MRPRVAGPERRGPADTLRRGVGPRVRRGTGAAAVALLLACGSDGPTETGKVDVRSPGTLVLQPAEVTLDSIGATVQIEVTLLDERGEEMDFNPGSLVWSSSPTVVATVSSMGLVTARGHGTATVTASMDDPGSAARDIEGDASVTVPEPAEP